MIEMKLSKMMHLIVPVIRVLEQNWEHLAKVDLSTFERLIPIGISIAMCLLFRDQ